MVTLGRGLCRYGSCVLYAHGYVDKLHCFDWLNGYVHIQFIGIYGGRCVVGQITNHQEVIQTALVDQVHHECCIKQRDGMSAHYHEVGADEDCDFEHLIPAARIRDLLLASAISVEQALNAPTVRLSRTKHAALKEAGWASTTPDMWCPFRRYTQVFDATYETHDGTAIDPDTWTLEQHFDYFKHLVIN